MIEPTPQRRLDIFFERHIGFGIRWDNYHFQLELSIAFPFVTIAIGIGKRQ